VNDFQHQEPELPKHTGEEITLHLIASSTETMKFCVYCRTTVFISKHRVVAIAEEEPLKFLSPPIKIPCKKCRVRYSIQTIT